MGTRNLPAPILDEMVLSGELSPLAKVPSFSLLDEYPQKYLRAPPARNIPAIMQITKSTGSPNFNHFAYVPISKQYFCDFMAVFQKYPGAYLNEVTRSWRQYFKAADDNRFLSKNRAKMDLYSRAFDRLLCGEVPEGIPIGLRRSERNYLTLLVGLPLLFLYGVVALFSHPRGQAKLGYSQRRWNGTAFRSSKPLSPSARIMLSRMPQH